MSDAEAALRRLWETVASSWTPIESGIRDNVVQIIAVICAYLAATACVALVRGARRRRSFRNLAERVTNLERLAGALKNAEDRRLMADTKRFAHVPEKENLS